MPWLLSVGNASCRSESIDPALAKDWLERWEKSILADAEHNRYCDQEMGEEIGWRVSPFLNGFYYGYLATKEEKWVQHFCDWADSLIKRAVVEPDGHSGWPKGDGGGGESTEFNADSLLGEAMVMRPIVLMADLIVKTPALRGKWKARAQAYLNVATRNFEKWDKRDAWRETKEGGVWVVSGFGVDLKTGKWSSGYEQRKTIGFTNPDNKQNHIARWLVAMSDVIGKPVYRERAEKWFRVMKSRLKTHENGRYLVWNYWEPAGPWDYKPGGEPKHWIGVHPNGGYYQIDAEAITMAFEHGWVFNKADLDRLIATNRDFMWNQQLKPAKFQRIDGGEVDARWKNSPGLLWASLVPHDETLRRIFIANHDPGSWVGLAATPWFLSLPG